MTIGERIARYREEKGLSQDELAAMLGYKSRATICKIELGKRNVPRDLIVKLSAILEVSPIDLLGVEENPPPSEDKWEILRAMISQLSDESLLELREYIRFLIWRENQKD